MFDYTVQGRGEFPQDMLRHDQSTYWDTAAKEKANSEEFTVRRYVHLMGPNRPNVARWKSFGWRVTAINGTAQERLGEERTATRTEEAHRLLEEAKEKIEQALTLLRTK